MAAQARGPEPNQQLSFSRHAFSPTDHLQTPASPFPVPRPTLCRSFPLTWKPSSRPTPIPIVLFRGRVPTLTRALRSASLRMTSPQRAGLYPLRMRRHLPWALCACADATLSPPQLFGSARAQEHSQRLSILCVREHHSPFWAHRSTPAQAFYHLSPTPPHPAATLCFLHCAGRPCGASSQCPGNAVQS